MSLYERIERFAPVTDLTIRSEGDGRTVDAYAAVFNTPQEIRDRYGHYLEVIEPTAFNRSLAQRGDRLQVIFNHGMTLHGTPSERFSMPIGVATEVRPDGNGLFTRSAIARTDLGDEVLELIRAGAIAGMSFSGPAYRSKRQRAATPDGLPTIIRQELGLREYGPTPFPSYADARIVAVRADLATIDLDEIVAYVATLDEPTRAALVDALAPRAADPGTPDPDAPADPGTAVVPFDTAERVERLRICREALTR